MLDSTKPNTIEYTKSIPCNSYRKNYAVFKKLCTFKRITNICFKENGILKIYDKLLDTPYFNCLHEKLHLCTQLRMQTCLLLNKLLT